MASEKQQLIDNPNVTDAVGINTATPIASTVSVQGALLPLQPNGTRPAKELSGWEKRQAVADQRRTDHPFLWRAGKVFVLCFLGLGAYVIWAAISARSTPEYVACLATFGNNPNSESKQKCTSEVAGKLYFGH